VCAAKRRRRDQLILGKSVCRRDVGLDTFFAREKIKVGTNIGKDFVCKPPLRERAHERGGKVAAGLLLGGARAAAAAPNNF
jgi:hypothetical protein